MTESLLSRTPQQDRWLGETSVGKSRVAAYSPELGLLIAEYIANGVTLRKISQMDGMPSTTTVHRWLMLYPEFSTAYNAAREISAYNLEDEALDLARLIRSLPGDSPRVRAFDIAINQLRWSASRRNPRVYSDKAALNITVPIQINTTMDLSEGPAKALPGDETDPNAVFTITAQLPNPEPTEPIDVPYVPVLPATEAPEPEVVSAPTVVTKKGDRRGRPPGPSKSKRQLKPRQP